MGSRFMVADRETPFLFPPSVQEWLPEDPLARFVADAVEHLDLRPLEAAYRGRGSLAHHPGVLLALLFYGYATGVFSSRKIERATYDSVAFRYLAANTHPDHDTIATFRRRFLSELEPLFVQLLELACELKLLRLSPGESGRDQDPGQRQPPQGAELGVCGPSGSPAPGGSGGIDGVRRAGGCPKPSRWPEPARGDRPSPGAAGRPGGSQAHDRDPCPGALRAGEGRV